jgi:hypothetical protein
MRFILNTSIPVPEALAGWPDWLVVTLAAVGLVAGIWLLGKLLKLALWLLLIAVLVAGSVAVAILLLK